MVDAAGLDSFGLFGMSQGCSAAVAYAVRNTGRVRRMVFYGGYPRGWRVRATPEEVATTAAIT